MYRMSYLSIYLQIALSCAICVLGQPFSPFFSSPSLQEIVVSDLLCEGKYAELTYADVC
jgi:hypothetical protein